MGCVEVLSCLRELTQRISVDQLADEKLTILMRVGEELDEDAGDRDYATDCNGPPPSDVQKIYVGPMKRRQYNNRSETHPSLSAT